VTVAARAKYMVDVHEQHLEELGFLWGQWRVALTDADYTLPRVGELEDRIRAHLQGIQVPGEHAWPRLLELLGADDPDLVFAAAYALLHTHNPDLVTSVADAFIGAQSPIFEAIGEALKYSPLPATALQRIYAHLSARPAMRAVTAGEVLAFHGALSISGEQFRYFIEDEDPLTRIAAWRLAALVSAQLSPNTYAQALRDRDAGASLAALYTAGWCGVGGVINAVRHVCEANTASLESLYLLAVIGQGEDRRRIHAALLDSVLGPHRFALAGAFGSPALVPVVLSALDDPDPATAAAAGGALTRITGVDVESNTAADVQPADGSKPDEFEQEFQDSVMLPDPPKARREWERVRPRLETLPRVCRGIDASRLLNADAIEVVDMRSRHEAYLRAKLYGQWTGALLQLERFPQAVGAGGAPATRDRPVAAAS
jgi:uncharacterized protein (TIGR02270 family)